MDEFQQTLKAFSSGDDLPASIAESFFDELINSNDEPMLAEIFSLWDQKGIAESEIYSIAKIMRERGIKVVSRHKTFVDIVGTGGSKAKTFNVSTAAAFVVAGMGVAVAKHGNRASTSSSGSSDVLSALGIEPAIDAATAQQCLNEVGICFMYAPNFHRLSPTLAKVRRSLGFPTIFNCVGPLCNPAGAPHQLIGVWDRSLVSKTANALALLGTKRSWVVHGADGLDEISVGGPTFVAEVEGRTVKTFELTPDDLFLSSRHATEMTPRGPNESAEIIRRVLEFKRADSFEEDLVLANAMAAFHISVGSSMSTCRQLARDSITNSHALRKMKELAGAVLQ